MAQWQKNSFKADPGRVNSCTKGSQPTLLSSRLKPTVLRLLESQYIRPPSGEDLESDLESRRFDHKRHRLFDQTTCHTHNTRAPTKSDLPTAACSYQDRLALWLRAHTPRHPTAHAAHHPATSPRPRRSNEKSSRKERL